MDRRDLRHYLDDLFQVIGGAGMIIYSLLICPKCKTLKSHLDSINYPYQEGSFEEPETITEMRCSGFFGLSAPVIEIAGKYHGPEEFFDGNVLNEEKLRRLL